MEKIIYTPLLDNDSAFAELRAALTEIGDDRTLVFKVPSRNVRLSHDVIKEQPTDHVSLIQMSRCMGLLNTIERFATPRGVGDTYARWELSHIPDFGEEKWMSFEGPKSSMRASVYAACEHCMKEGRSVRLSAFAGEAPNVPYIARLLRSYNLYNGSDLTVYDKAIMRRSELPEEAAAVKAVTGRPIVEGSVRSVTLAACRQCVKTGAAVPVSNENEGYIRSIITQFNKAHGVQLGYKGGKVVDRRRQEALSGSQFYKIAQATMDDMKRALDRVSDLEGADDADYPLLRAKMREVLDRLKWLGEDWIRRGQDKPNA
jgi:hypothetical protein